MQMITLVNQAAGSAITGSAVTYRPVAGFTSVFVAEVKRTAGSGTPTTTANVSLQGSLDGTDWFTVDSFVVSSMTNSVGTTDWGSVGGYRTYVKVVQGFPLMRLATSGSISADVNLVAYIANG